MGWGGGGGSSGWDVQVGCALGQGWLAYNLSWRHMQRASQQRVTPGWKHAEGADLVRAAIFLTEASSRTLTSAMICEAMQIGSSKAGLLSNVVGSRSKC